MKDLSDIPLPDVQEKPSLESILNEVSIRVQVIYSVVLVEIYCMSCMLHELISCTCVRKKSSCHWRS